MAILSLQNVGYKVDTNEILKNINLDVNKNEFITITGPSGGGKSTLLKIIATLLTATTGEIFFDGKNQDEYAITEYRQQVSYCFQQPSLFGETVFDNLSFPYEIRQKEFDEKTCANNIERVWMDNIHNISIRYSKDVLQKMQKWYDSFIGDLEARIADFNPTLKELVRQQEVCSQEIQHLEDLNTHLTQSQAEIRHLFELDNEEV